MLRGNSILRTHLCQPSQSHLARSADLLTGRARGLQLQVGVQGLDLCAIAAFPILHIRESKIGASKIGIAEKCLTRAFFRLVQPVEPHQRLTQHNIPFGPRIFCFQSSSDDYLRLARLPFLTQKVAISELRQGVPPATQIDGRLKCRQSLIIVAQGGLCQA